ncbi:dTDP-4-dehydrorhamnose 3,5-epimerase family protein [Candidatus Giovannonibacteria bacterium]|nr:dTDP-4-dehydrorhamnose 3,5-epimerase family protein [Candidatus Giovannonibacteria bacterium]
MKINFRELAISGLWEAIPEQYEDERGSLSRLFDRELFLAAGINARRVQETLQISKKKNTLRGLHVSLPPNVEGKMITSVRGEVFWVAVDVRRKSAHFGQWVGITLTDGKKNIFIAEPGFAFGCLSLTDNSASLINAEKYYSDEHGTGINCFDGYLGIEWPFRGLEDGVIMRERDQHYPRFIDFVAKYGGV